MARSKKLSDSAMAELVKFADDYYHEIQSASDTGRSTGVEFDPTTEQINVMIRMSRAYADLASMLASHKEMAERRAAILAGA